MSPLLLAAALLGALAPSARAGVVEVSMPGESVSIKTGAAPAITLHLGALNGLTPLSLAPAVPLAPALAAPTPLAVAPALVVAAPLAAAAIPDKPVDALRATGAALAKSAPASPEAAGELKGLFDGGAVPKAAPAIALDAGSANAPALERSAPRPARRMPPGVARAFQNSAVLGGGMAALSGGLYAWTQQLASAPTPLQFALLALPMLMIPLHFALISSFWAGRYFAYPRVSPAAKTAFRRAWLAASVVYPLAATAALAAWFQLVGNNPTMLALMGLPALVALGEITHHFIYRVTAERKQDEKKPLLDWRGRAGGNIGQQLRRMKP